MRGSFINSLSYEWLKKRRSLASWIVIIGSFFTPTIIVIARLVHYKTLKPLYNSEDFWDQLWRSSWESMALFLLPLGIILFTSLITQIEYKNNTWKQVNTLPLHWTTLFFSKFVVIIGMLLQFFVLFNIGIYLSALIPYLLVSGVPYPKQPLPYLHFLKENAYYFIDCLPIVALQYLISLKYRNFLVSVGAGFMLWVVALASLAWKFNYFLPYTYCMLNYLKDVTGKAIIPTVNIHLLAVVYFSAITSLNYLLYRTKKEKG